MGGLLPSPVTRCIYETPSLQATSSTRPLLYDVPLPRPLFTDTAPPMIFSHPFRRIHPAAAAQLSASCSTTHPTDDSHFVAHRSQYTLFSRSRFTSTAPPFAASVTVPTSSPHSDSLPELTRPPTGVYNFPGFPETEPLFLLQSQINGYCRSEITEILNIVSTGVSCGSIGRTTSPKTLRIVRFGLFTPGYSPRGGISTRNTGVTNRV